MSIIPKIGKARELRGKLLTEYKIIPYAGNMVRYILRYSIIIVWLILFTNISAQPARAAYDVGVLFLEPRTATTPVSVGQELALDVGVNVGTTYTLDTVRVTLNFNEQRLGLTQGNCAVSASFVGIGGQIPCQVGIDTITFQLKTKNAIGPSGTHILARLFFTTKQTGTAEVIFTSNDITVKRQDGITIPLPIINTLSGSYIIGAAGGGPTNTPIPISTATPAPTAGSGCNTSNPNKLSCFELWRREFMGEAGTLLGDFDGNGRVTLADFEVFRRAFQP